MIAALFVASNGPYFGLSHVDPWDIAQDARNYAGPWPVVAHPPCERWGRYATGGPNPKARRFAIGDDNGCFASALKSVREFGGVIEHPEATHAYRNFGLAKPPKTGGWIPAGDGLGFVCCVEQGNYGHVARKATWLYCVGAKVLPELIWGKSKGIRLDEGFHSSEERQLARARGQAPIRRLSERERIHSPVAFRDMLISLAESCIK